MLPSLGREGQQVGQASQMVSSTPRLWSWAQRLQESPSESPRDPASSWLVHGPLECRQNTRGHHRPLHGLPAEMSGCNGA